MTAGGSAVTRGWNRVLLMRWMEMAGAHYMTSSKNAVDISISTLANQGVSPLSFPRSFETLIRTGWPEVAMKAAASRYKRRSY